MTDNKRKSFLTLVATITVGFLLLDRLLLTPYLRRKERLQEQRQQLLTEWRQLQKIRSREKALAADWKSLVETGFRSDQAAAVINLLFSIRRWAEEARFTLVAIKPERPVNKGALREIIFQVSGTGTMADIAAFLWRVEQSALPVKIAELRLVTRKEGTDDLNLQMRVVTLCQQERSKQPDKQIVKQQESENEIFP
ncbi:MAG: type 4a pilus biogenesis protein PilO [Candidatus Omnitrophica bacterium]|nr:type 4a pilus biogenesis protein PilO [Candidatus Omnitrophota bacterium]